MGLTKSFWWLVLAALLPWAGASRAAGPDADGLRGRLASVEWLQRHLSRDDVLVLDASTPSARPRQRIPGSQPAGLFTFGPREVTAAQMESRLRSLGASPGMHIVIVDEGGSYGATRLFWDLLQAGLPADSLYILDGGMARWTARGGAVTDQVSPARPPGTLRVGVPAPDTRVRLPEFLAATADPHANVMLEALDPEYFYGGASFFGRAGHVPHATLMPSDDFFNEDKTFKSPAEMQRMLDHLGIRREQQVLTYCGGGGAAAVPFFALKYMLGYPKVKLFVESQRGWLQDPRDLPVWTYGAPHLVRDTDWLKAWGSPMLKRFGLSQVTAVDVRPAEAFGLGHVPLAVNVPGDVFKANLRRPEALAAALGQAGLDRSHEAVVLSEGGLNESSALAFLMLEQAGQQKVSIHLDSLDRWIDQGGDVARPAATTSAARSAPSAPSAPAAPAAPPNAATTRSGERHGVLLSDPHQSAGLFPTVFIASGAQAPTRAPAGRTIHLPYTQLLDAGGKPKAAKDLWTLLSKAGVPRYARLVLFADVPGAAAVNYVLFRMMGFADIKVWLP